MTTTTTARAPLFRGDGRSEYIDGGHGALDILGRRGALVCLGHGEARGD